MNCHYCHGVDTYQEVKTRYFSPADRRPFFLENLPVSECVQCGEQVLSSDAMDVLDSIHYGEGHPVSFATIPVYDHDNLAGYPQKMRSFPFSRMLDCAQIGRSAGAGISFLAGPFPHTVAGSYPPGALPVRILKSPSVVVSPSPEIRYTGYSVIPAKLSRQRTAIRPRENREPGAAKAGIHLAT